jgi:hypothetical protein
MARIPSGHLSNTMFHGGESVELSAFPQVELTAAQVANSSLMGDRHEMAKAKIRSCIVADLIDHRRCVGERWT